MRYRGRGFFFALAGFATIVCTIASVTSGMNGEEAPTAATSPPSPARVTKLAPDKAAELIDKRLKLELLQDAEPAPLADDATFLRRATLDLVGEVPTADEVMNFVLDTSQTKRDDLITELLQNAKFGQNWARYWRDVIMYRQSDPRGAIASQALLRYLEDQFIADASWKDITTSFITAEGDVTENGATAFFMAHNGNAEEVAAEISRVFLGIQIQCAQCHDHPTDRWKREQFHELAAFLPRVQVRPKQTDGGPRSFIVSSRDNNPPGRGRGPAAGRRGRGGPEHYMSDLENPSARGTLMQPKFFVDDERLAPGQTDAKRRQALAEMITAEDNPWFARAFVNRVWSEMVGEGFYEPIDDMGPDRQCTAPETLDVICEQFIANNYSVKWLYGTIARTEAYQRASRERRDLSEVAFEANCAQRLRGDQLYDVLAATLGGGDAQGPLAGRGGRGGARGNQRNGFNAVFGFDPSNPRDELSGSIPQALFMMNAPNVTRGVDGQRPTSTLAKLLREYPQDKDAITELYLRCLSRVPNALEVQTCRDYLAEVHDRRTGYEDLFWALINSAEFLHRR